jgi:hypothetical protein
MDEHVCTPFLWDPSDPTENADPSTAKTTPTPKPALANGTKVNIFCAGHAFLPDGRLLVAGGHLSDGDGVNQASLYDFAAPSGNASGTWQPTALMLHGRWYPTATTLPDGGVLVLAGSFMENQSPPTRHNRHPQVWSNGAWRTLAPFLIDMDLYPRAHVISDGRVFISGPLQTTWILNTAGGGSWQRTTAEHPGQFDYAPAVMYDVDKIIYIGGGGGFDNQLPSKEARIIDLGKTPHHWVRTNPMNFRRRQHNATLLPDGTVLVTGGTQGAGFNNLAPGQPVHTAELWDPATGQWTALAAEAVDRCYHSTAVLLPDATVLSAGGGEFKVAGGLPNDPRDTPRNAQIFRPPYLFRGERPEITNLSVSRVQYGDTFEVETPHADEIAKVSWISLSSVTHAFNQTQRINFLQFSGAAGKLVVTTPSSANLCPPGHYMLFLLNEAGVPSVARIIRIAAGAESGLESLAAGSSVEIQPREDTFSDQAALVSAAKGTAVVVGITSTCPYGLGACWGGAQEALSRLGGVDLVNPAVNVLDSTAEVFLAGLGLPPLGSWSEQFQRIVNGRYEWRGAEVTLHGIVYEQDQSFFMAGNERRPPVQLAPLRASDKIQYDNTARTSKPMDADEASSYRRLKESYRNWSDPTEVTVTGPLTQTDTGYRLHVRVFDSDGEH